jgi:hypothetical protein
VSLLNPNLTNLTPLNFKKQQKIRAEVLLIKYLLDYYYEMNVRAIKSPCGTFDIAEFSA